MRTVHETAAMVAIALAGLTIDACSGASSASDVKPAGPPVVAVSCKGISVTPCEAGCCWAEGHWAED